MSAPNGVFLDTNILVYQFDRTSRVKQKKAQNIIDQSIESGQANISSQVIQEFMNVALKKFDTRIPAQELKLVIQDLLAPLCRHFPDINYYERVLNLYTLETLNFYDAMIVQAAIDLGCNILYSEDLQAGHKFGNLLVVNPFE